MLELRTCFTQYLSYLMPKGEDSSCNIDRVLATCIPKLKCRTVVPGCAWCAMAHPDFGRSVNPMSTRGDRVCPPKYYWHTQIFRASDGPETGMAGIIFEPHPPNFEKLYNF
jgi:hypothetical protein